MRTTDFSRAPRQGQAEAIVVVETVGRPRVPAGPSASAHGEPARAAATPTDPQAGHEAAALSPGEIATALQRAPGHVWSKRFTRRGFSQGVVACFATVADANAATAGLGRTMTMGATSMTVLAADPSGYSNGVWRAEGNVMAHIPTFTPTSVEVARGATGPRVAPSPPDAPAPRSSAAPRSTSSSHPTPGTPPPHRHRHRFGEICRHRVAEPTKIEESIHRRRGARVEKAVRAKSERPAKVARAEKEVRAVTDARAMFIGATKYRGPRALVQLSRTWYPMVARMQTLRGYVWHTVYWEPPFTLGTLAFFATRDDLLSFARLPAHRTLMQWITRDTRNGTGGYIRLHLAPGKASDQAPSGADERSNTPFAASAAEPSTTDSAASAAEPSTTDSATGAGTTAPVGGTAAAAPEGATP